MKMTSAVSAQPRATEARRRGLRKRSPEKELRGNEKKTKNIFSKSDKVELEFEAEVENEALALEQTGTEFCSKGKNKDLAQRVLKDFCFKDGMGSMISLESFELHQEVYVSGCVYPVSGRGDKLVASSDRSLGRRVERIGPCTAWRIANIEMAAQGEAAILVQTHRAKYILDVPKANYRR